MTKKKSEARAGLLFASPWVIGFGVFLAYPLLASLYYSFCDYSVLKPAMWIGLSNYAELMSDDLFWKTLWNTLVFAAFSLPLSLILALSLALLLNSKIKGLALYRTIFFLPSLVPLVSLAMLWLWLFNGENGIINETLRAIGMTHPPLWLTDKLFSKPAMVIMSMWGVGHAMVIYLAGLQGVPVSLYEAADLDGAKPFKKFWHVTVPMLSPVILFNFIMGLIGALQVFAVPYIMFPGGAPERSTYFYAMYLYDNAFRFNRMGYASAMGWIMFILIFALTMFSLRASEKKVHYGS
jgi:multiple sugar transport system permease protein